MTPETAIKLFIPLTRAHDALAEAMVDAIKTREREVGNRLLEAIARVLEVIDECTNVAPALRHLPHNDWPEREDPP